MKKLLCVALALCLMLSLLAACGGDSAPADDKTDAPSASNPAGNSGTDTATKYSINDFEGTWKLGNGHVACYTVNAAEKTVTAYADNGIVIATFPVAETDEGVVLKMGAFGNITLKDPTELTVTAAPTATEYDLVGSYEMIYGEYIGATLNIISNNEWNLDATKPDSGPYEITNGEAHFSPTKELGGTVYHKILGGGKVLMAYQPSNRVYVDKEYAKTDDGKAISNYFYLMKNKWVDSSDSNFTAEFTDKGRVLIAGEDMGLWYPTANGATAELIDGSTQEVKLTDTGIDFYYKNFKIAE